MGNLSARKKEIQMPWDRIWLFLCTKGALRVNCFAMGGKENCVGFANDSNTNPLNGTLKYIELFIFFTKEIQRRFWKDIDFLGSSKSKPDCWQIIATIFCLTIEAMNCNIENHPLWLVVAFSFRSGIFYLTCCNQIHTWCLYMTHCIQPWRRFHICIYIQAGWRAAVDKKKKECSPDFCCKQIERAASHQVR